MSNRSMVKMIHADGFFADGDAQRYSKIVSNLPFIEKYYGYEIENFNMILSGLEPILSKVLGERVIIDNVRSGIFRRPFNNVIRFEDFSSLNEWCFIVALERNTLNLYHHLKHNGFVDNGFREYDICTALDLKQSQVNFKNIFEWDIHTNILLEPNQGIFIRPWVFHSLTDGLVQYYRLITDKKFRILVIGQPGSGRSRFCQLLQEAISDSKLLDSMEVRIDNKDIDYTYDGRIRHTYRMLSMARTDIANTVIIDMCCPLDEQRTIINADVLVWIDDKSVDMLEEWQNPKLYDLRIKNLDQIDMQEILEKINSKRI